MRPPAIDLHLHSTASDGAVTPAEVARRARVAGLSAVALSDHDTTQGLSSFAAEAQGLTVIPAIELTCRVRAGPLGTVHVLGYGIDPAHAELQRVARVNRLAKRQQVADILRGLRVSARIELAWEDVAAGCSDDGYVGRHHVATALLLRGVVRSRQRAFRRFLRAERVPSPDVVPAEEALAAIHGAGGVSVLAHPTDVDIDHHLRPLMRAGLRGVEVHRPRVRPDRLARLQQLAARHELLVTGGSDWHGHHPEGPLGTWSAPHGVLLPALERLA